MNLDQAISYWKQKLTDGKPIKRVRVRRILEMEGAERRGDVIPRRISKKLENNGLRTVPDFQSGWIDAQVRIELTEERSDFVRETCADIPLNDDLNSTPRQD